MSGYTIKIEGVDELVKNLKKFSNRATRKKVVNAAQRDAFNRSGIINVAKAQTPVSAYKHSSNRGGKVKHLPGNLRKSIGLITGKSKKFPNVQLGYRAGEKRKNDGWYGFMVHEGLGGRKKGGKSKPHPAFKTAFEFRGSSLNREFADALVGRMVKEQRKSGLR